MLCQLLRNAKTKQGWPVCWRALQHRSAAMFTVVIDRTFGLAKLFGRTSTVRFSPNDRTFFCRTQNLFCVLHSMPMASFYISVLLNDPHVRVLLVKQPKECQQSQNWNETFISYQFKFICLFVRSWISRASGWQTERADCNYLKK